MNSLDLAMSEYKYDTLQAKDMVKKLFRNIIDAHTKIENHGVVEFDYQAVMKAIDEL